MQHIVAHTVPPHWLIHDWHEAAELWRRLQRLGPLRAAVIMPDHVHLVLRSVHWPSWLGCLSGYARWRNHRRDEHGRCVWLPAPPAQAIQSHQHLQTTIRYVHLNPCRAKLVSDPLAWPFSTHRAGRSRRWWGCPTQPSTPAHPSPARIWPGSSACSATNASGHSRTA